MGQDAHHYMVSFQSKLTEMLKDPSTDPETAPVEAMHASGLHEYVTRLDRSIGSKVAAIDTASAALGASPPTSSETPFEAAAPVLVEQAKAKSRRALGVAALELGLVVVAIWAASVLSADPYDLAKVNPPSSSRTFFLLGVGLMIVSAASGVVYVT